MTPQRARSRPALRTWREHARKTWPPKQTFGCPAAHVERARTRGGDGLTATVRARVAHPGAHARNGTRNGNGTFPTPAAHVERVRTRERPRCDAAQGAHGNPSNLPRNRW